VRRVRREERSSEELRVSATDPLNLVGILTPGPRVPAHPGRWLVFRDGALEESESKGATRSAPEELDLLA
jgi:ATP-dependent Lhr-like helicase